LRCLYEAKIDADPFLRGILQNRNAGEFPRLTALGVLSLSTHNRAETTSLLQAIVADHAEPVKLRDSAATVVADPTNEQEFKQWLLSDGSVEDQLVAVGGLMKIREKESVPILLDAYKKVADFEVKRRILVALALFPDQDSVFQWLQSVAKSDPDPALRRTAYDSLIQIGHESSNRDVSTILLAGLNDTDPIVLGDLLRFLAMEGTSEQHAEALKRIGNLEDPELKAQLLNVLRIFHKDQ
jgi:HEAT repeat protein